MPPAPLQRAEYVDAGFNDDLSWLPYALKRRDFENALASLYDFFQLVNTALMDRGLDWLEHAVQPAAVSTMISDMTTNAIAKHSNGLVVNRHHNGYPDLIPRGHYEGDSVEAGSEGVEIKSTRGRVADTHGARNGWFCQFNYNVDNEPIVARRRPLTVVSVYCAYLTSDLYRVNERLSGRGTRTETPNAAGLKVLRERPVYLHPRESA